MASRTRRPSPQTAAVLRLLLDGPDRWRHGYELSQETGIASGTLYPLLMRLADRGYLEARWEEPSEQGRPPRHLYRLTDSGRSHAASAAEISLPHRRLRPVGESA